MQLIRCTVDRLTSVVGKVLSFLYLFLHFGNFSVPPLKLICDVSGGGVDEDEKNKVMRRGTTKMTATEDVLFLPTNFKV